VLAPLLLLGYQSRLDALLDDPKLRGAIVSAVVTDLEGNPLYERNPHLRVVPASNQKLLSNAFALHALGADWRPQTRIWKQPDRTYVESLGDPLLSFEKLVEARTRLKLNRRLPVYVRQEYAPGIPDTWEFDDLPNRYAAPVTAFTVDRGGFELWNQAGKPVLLPDSYGVKIQVRQAVAKPTVQYDPFSRRVTVTGTLPKERARLDTLALPRSDEAAAKVLGNWFLPAEDLPQRTPDLVIVGRTTAEMVAACLPPSDNNIAEHLMLLGARAGGPLGARPYTPARERMTAFLTRVVGVAPEDVRVYDGSGLSRHNLVTSSAVAKLLAWSNRQPTAPVWRAAMARPGKGTLATRLQGIAFEGKTGTLDMVVGLSGYVMGKDGKERIVSVVLNHFTSSSTEARNLADEFVRQVADGAL